MKTAKIIPIHITIILFSFFTSCKDHNKNEIENESNSIIQKLEIMKDTTPKVTGIGGIFFKSANPKETMDWYGKNLGLAIDSHGSAFEFRNANNPEDINYLRWGLFDESTDYFDPSKKDFMINYRVQNIEALVRQLKENGVTIVDEITTYDYGKFVHLKDNEGNKVELWEPIDSFFTKMGGPTTK